MATTKMTVTFTRNDKGNPPRKARRCGAPLRRTVRSRLEVDRLRYLGDAERSATERDVPRASVQRQWRNGVASIATANQRHCRTRSHPRLVLEAYASYEAGLTRTA